MTTPEKPTFDEYVGSLSQLTVIADPTVETKDAATLRAAAASLTVLDEVTADGLATWVGDHPNWVPALGLTVGLSQEKLKNVLKHHFGTTGWVTLARTRPAELITMLDDEFSLVQLVDSQRSKAYTFGDILIARGGTRGTAAQAGVSGRKVEDEIEAIAVALGLDYETRTRFTGRAGRSAPCDLVIPGADNASIVVAAKGFDSTGSKLSDAVREVMEMADVRTPRQYVLAVIDGIGWKSPGADLRRIYDLWASDQIDGMYTLADMSRFSLDLTQAARLRGLL
jgi:hypothetical protein